MYFMVVNDQINHILCIYDVPFSLIFDNYVSSM